MSQQKALQVLARLARYPHRRRPCPDQVAHRLMGRIRHPDGRQFSGTVQLRQHHGVATVRLHPIARPHRDQRRGHHDTVIPHLDKLAVETIAARPRLIAEMQLRSARPQLLDQLAHMIRPVQHRSPVANLAAAFALRYRH